MSWRTAELGFDANHPTARGHFPGNPMIPGALLLDSVIEAIAGDAAVTLRAAKFLHIVRPGEKLDLRWQASPAGGIAFECRLQNTETLAAAGRLEITP